MNLTVTYSTETDKTQAVYLHNYTTYSQINNLNDFFDHVETVDQKDIKDIIALVKMHHETHCNRLTQNQDIEIYCIHPQDDDDAPFKAIAVDDDHFVILCDLFVEYGVIERT